MCLPAELAQQRLLDLSPGHIPHVQNPTLRVAPFFAKVEFAVAGDLALVELQTNVDKVLNSHWSFRHNRTDDLFVTKACARFQCVAYMQLE